MKPFLEVCRLSSRRQRPEARVVDVNLTLQPGSATCLYGPEVEDQNYLLRLIGLHERPDSGEIYILQEPTGDWDDTRRANLRAQLFGFVFNTPFLLPGMTVLENVVMPFFRATSSSPEEARSRAERLLRFAGILDLAGEVATRLPFDLQQRVALVRALVVEPSFLLVEHPDKHLRDDGLIGLLSLLDAVRKSFGCTVFLTAQTRDVAALTSRGVEMREGRIVDDWEPRAFRVED